MRRPVFLLGVVLVAAAAVALGSYLAGALPPDPGASDGVDAEPTFAGPPELTAAQREKAVEIMEADSRFQELLAGRPYRVTSVGVWHTRDLRLIGAGIIVALEEPASFGQTDWPQVDFQQPDLAAGSYETSTVRYGVEGVTEIEVMVDFAAGAVVEIEPSEFESAVPPPGFTPVYDGTGD